jgi:hypothetical protein
MISFTPSEVLKCFGTVVADVTKMNKFEVNTWLKSTFPEVSRIVSQNPDLFNSGLANASITQVPRKPNRPTYSKNFDGKEYSSKVKTYNSVVGKIRVAFAIDLRAAMGCAGYTEDQIKKAVDAFNKLLPDAINIK